MFPNKKWFIFNDGWVDLGAILLPSGTLFSELTDYPKCNNHKVFLRTGFEKGELFKFCQHCLVKVK